LNTKIDIIIVIYNPNEDLLSKCILSIFDTVRHIYIIDNSDINISLNIDYEYIKYIKLKENMGISYAFNIGIKESIKNKSDYILLTDQDTVYPIKYIDNMLKTFDNEENICAVTTLFKDTNSAKKNEGFYKKSFLFAKRFFPIEGSFNVFHTISSGKILNTKYINDIGLMDEDLFIDWVDYEWCWRARKKGYKIIGNADVVIDHQLGDESTDVGFRVVNLRSPLRHYYITRNAFYLSIYNNSLNSINKVTLFFKSFRYIIGYPILSKPHLKHLKYVLLGFWHGMTGKLGKLNNK